MLAVGVRVVADLVASQGGDYVLAAAPLEGARLLAHHLEGGADALLRQQLRHPLRRVIARGKDVVLGVEPEDDVDPAGALRLGARSRRAPAEDDCDGSHTGEKRFRMRSTNAEAQGGDSSTGRGPAPVALRAPVRGES